MSMEQGAGSVELDVTPCSLLPATRCHETHCWPRKCWEEVRTNAA